MLTYRAGKPNLPCTSATCHCYQTTTAATCWDMQPAISHSARHGNMSAWHATGRTAVWRHWTNSRPANNSRIYRCINEHMLLMSILLLLNALFACVRSQNKTLGCMHTACDCQLVTISTKHDAHGGVQALIKVRCAGVAVREGTAFSGLHGQQQDELPADLLNGLSQFDQRQLLGTVF